MADAGLTHRVSVQVADWRDLEGLTYDAVSSIGMFEHVGAASAPAYFEALRRLLRPGGRLLNHAISRPAPGRSALSRRTFVDRYVFPDGELLEVGATVSLAQAAGLEVRHVESLREHYARTLRCWVANLEADWDEAVAEAGRARARIWRLYMAGAARLFEQGATGIHQVLAVRADDDGTSAMPARPTW